MASVLKHAQLLTGSAAGRLDDNQRGLVKRLQADIERMQSLFSNLIGLRALVSGTLVLKPMPVDVSQVVEIALSRSKHRLDEKGLQTRLEIGVLPATNVDRYCMQQVMDNLVSHACRSSRTGSVIGIRAFGQDAGLDRRELHIAISHTSPEPGSEDATSGHTQRGSARSAHEPDGQASRAELTVAKTLVQTHHGKMWQESRPGIGGTLHLTIPVESRQPSPSRGNGRD